MAGIHSRIEVHATLQLKNPVTCFRKLEYTVQRIMRYTLCKLAKFSHMNLHGMYMYEHVLYIDMYTCKLYIVHV